MLGHSRFATQSLIGRMIQAAAISYVFNREVFTKYFILPFNMDKLWHFRDDEREQFDERKNHIANAIEIWRTKCTLRYQRNKIVTFLSHRSHIYDSNLRKFVGNWKLMEAAKWYGSKSAFTNTLTFASASQNVRKRYKNRFDFNVMCFEHEFHNSIVEIRIKLNVIAWCIENRRQDAAWTPTLLSLI